MNILPKEILERVSIKNVKQNFGHDLCGFYCDVYLDGKKAGYYNDDGWGGEPDITATNVPTFVAMQELFVKANMSQFQADSYNSGVQTFKKDWKASDFKFEDNLSMVTENLTWLREVEKKQKKALCYGKPLAPSYQIISWKEPLSEMFRKYPKQMTERVERLKRELGEGDVIFNTNLDELLKLNLQVN